MATSRRCSWTRRGWRSRVRHPNVVHAVDVVSTRTSSSSSWSTCRRVALAAPARRAAGDGRASRSTSRRRIVSGHAPRVARAHTRRRRARRAARHRASRRVSPERPGRRRMASRASSTSASRRRVTQAQVTRTGEIKGKLAYMAPEQLLGKPVTLQGRHLLGGHRLLGDAHGPSALLRRQRRRHRPQHPREPHSSAELAQPRRLARARCGGVAGARA